MVIKARELAIGQVFSLAGSSSTSQYVRINVPEGYLKEETKHHIFCLRLYGRPINLRVEWLSPDSDVLTGD